ncbi:leucine-rich repeat extensin-like protein 4 [Iris pallida]|uniref:Leucine-rich repeat extensin-like protein 4 n=1 Tax=Iris pallida TaxID=29817 RepID=A0AAX6GD06_IRIPA|nr:leucine-rich repeat extensin-like protein 4 [Iris pallida]
MDALSTTTHPVSSLRPKQFLSANPNNPLHLLKPPAPQSLPLPPFANLSAKPNSASLAPRPIPARSSLRSPSHNPAAVVAKTAHCSKAATGYAAALLDVAACDGQLAAVAKDVRRFAWAARAVLDRDEEVGEAVKGEVLTKVAEGGGFYAKLAVLVRMLVRKGKVRMVGEVMEEFGRLWGELSRAGNKPRALA